MGRISRRTLAAMAAVGLVAGALHAHAGSTDPLNSALWPDLAAEYLGGDVVFDNSLRLMMPDTVENAHEVPVMVKFSADLGQVTEFVVIAENNPIQVAARMFPRRPIDAIGLNIRLEQTTPVRVAARDEAGVWHVDSMMVNVLSPGGCSTPGAGGQLANIGAVAMKEFDRVGGSRLKVKINHPMDTGFAATEAGEPIPAYYIEWLTIADEAGPIMDLETWAAMSADPVVIMDMPGRRQNVRVTARDTKGLEFEAYQRPPSM